MWGDLDNDGDPDQYIVHGRLQDNELYWNMGNGTFVDGQRIESGELRRREADWYHPFPEEESIRP